MYWRVVGCVASVCAATLGAVVVIAPERKARGVHPRTGQRPYFARGNLPILLLGGFTRFKIAPPA